MFFSLIQVPLSIILKNETKHDEMVTMTTTEVVTAPGHPPVYLPRDHFHQIEFGEYLFSGFMVCMTPSSTYMYIHVFFLVAQKNLEGFVYIMPRQCRQLHVSSNGERQVTTTYCTKCVPAVEIINTFIFHSYYIAVCWFKQVHVFLKGSDHASMCVHVYTCIYGVVLIILYHMVTGDVRSS